MAITATERVDIINIVLMLVSAAVAFVMPFELFLFVYAVLGPLHYLTEISWLHDKNYYTKSKNDAIWLLVVGIALTLYFFKSQIGLDFPEMFDANLVFIGLLSALVFVTVKNPIYKIGGIILLVFVSQLAHNFNYFLTVFIPTLIHVYVFTAFFMLFGATKSDSRFRYWAVAVMLVIPFLLYYVLPEVDVFSATDYSKEVYAPFTAVNVVWFRYIEKIQFSGSMDALDDLIYHSPKGIVLMRFIAFAYTYHYLNWFSKTRIIQWHKVPKARFIVVIIIWVLSVALYLYNYMIGLQWLIFLSFMHVLLEFPLNCLSIIGVGKHIKNKMVKPANA